MDQPDTIKISVGSDYIAVRFQYTNVKIHWMDMLFNSANTNHSKIQALTGRYKIHVGYHGEV